MELTERTIRSKIQEEVLLQRSLMTSGERLIPDSEIQEEILFRLLIKLVE